MCKRTEPGFQSCSEPTRHLVGWVFDFERATGLGRTHSSIATIGHIFCYFRVDDHLGLGHHLIPKWISSGLRLSLQSPLWIIYQEPFKNLSSVRYVSNMMIGDIPDRKTKSSNSGPSHLHPKVNGEAVVKETTDHDKTLHPSQVFHHIP